MRKLTHTVYVVGWPENHIIKAGYTSGLRYRTFINRGAEVVALFQHPDPRTATGYEAALHFELAKVGGRAFKERGESLQYLGSGGAGWCECYQFDADSYPLILELIRASSPEGVHEGVRQGVPMTIGVLTRPDLT